jgi:hypothetical protein
MQWQFTAPLPSAAHGPAAIVRGTNASFCILIVTSSVLAAGISR